MTYFPFVMISYLIAGLVLGVILTGLILCHKHYHRALTRFEDTHNHRE